MSLPNNQGGAASASGATAAPGTPYLNKLVATTLTIGLVASLILMVIGSVILVVAPSTGSIHVTPLRAVPAGILHGNPIAFLSAGIVLLMATPALRVLIALYGYARERDWLFVGVSAIVFGVLVVSIAIGAK